MCIKIFSVKFTSSDLNGLDHSIYIYSLSCLFIKLNNAFVFHDTEHPIINIV